MSARFFISSDLTPALSEGEMRNKECDGHRGTGGKGMCVCGREGGDAVKGVNPNTPE